jgi:hypothetical protein
MNRIKLIWLSHEIAITSCFLPMPFPYHAKPLTQKLDRRELKFEKTQMCFVPKGYIPVGPTHVRWD